MITEFGKYLRKTRMDRSELLLDMAKKLGVTPSFLSAVEVGKKNVPTGWVDKIADLYDLDDSEKNNLSELAEEAALSVKLNLSKAGSPQRRAALVFARDFSTLSDKDADDLIRFFGKQEE